MVILVDLNTAKDVENWHLGEIGQAFVKAPLGSSKLSPFIVCPPASSHPGKVVQTAAPTKNLASSAFLMSAAVVPVNKCAFISPIVFGLDQIEGCSWDSDPIFFHGGTCDRQHQSRFIQFISLTLCPLQRQELKHLGSPPIVPLRSSLRSRLKTRSVWLRCCLFHSSELTANDDEIVLGVCRDVNYKRSMGE